MLLTSGETPAFSSQPCLEVDQTLGGTEDFRERLAQLSLTSPLPVLSPGAQTGRILPQRPPLP